MRTVVKPLEMISHTTEEGLITPIKFIMKDKDGSQIKCEVTRVQDRSTFKVAGKPKTAFVCQINIKNQIKLCEIRLDMESGKWQLFKI